MRRLPESVRYQVHQNLFLKRPPRACKALRVLITVARVVAVLRPRTPWSWRMVPVPPWAQDPSSCWLKLSPVAGEV